MFFLELFKLVCYFINELTVDYGTSRSWSSEGMLPPSSNGSFVQCYSTHLTSFAVLLAVETFVCLILRIMYNTCTCWRVYCIQPDSKALTIISYIGCGISMTCLLVTIMYILTFRYGYMYVECDALSNVLCWQKTALGKATLFHPPELGYCAALSLLYICCWSWNC